MATMGRWGNQSFTISTKKIRGFEGFSTAAEKKDKDSKSKKKSLELESVKLSIACHANAGVDPQKEYYTWRGLIGQTNYLYIHGKKWKSNRLQLQKVSLGSVTNDGKGRFRYAEISLEFTEENVKPSNKSSRSGASKADKKKKKKK
ncbi:hypothetical protein FYJ45_19690 [Eisenbergiella tayi]|uniref:Uncharacterized protein n=1 Tax=Eisenbergiella porci TaxID=2652274 RepID=A0A6N7W5B6_9FIRM|nr:hypothetical protein [Eisenbergiella porci]MSS90419.1 hypothetical protein [Eisenbergiella porci]